jgi:hypothetical protein
VFTQLVPSSRPLCMPQAWQTNHHKPPYQQQLSSTVQCGHTTSSNSSAHPAGRTPEASQHTASQILRTVTAVYSASCTAVDATACTAMCTAPRVAHKCTAGVVAGILWLTQQVAQASNSCQVHLPYCTQLLPAVLLAPLLLL